MNYIVENCLILIPVLYVIGAIVKGVEIIKDKYIPLVLLPIGIGLALAIKGIKVANLCESKKRAKEVADMWNECHKTNKQYMFTTDDPTF